ncbi:unnamed protein product [Ceutorhynchus assimilis]|uniref:Uncharacterized protein n=1 Tax=Ceutorhynchus assimilis TaxID=467358 RepID=A0A9N9MPQ3_9CUCU|nr:unnamed protein product [Ceutorhynchus assimilis]
MSASAECSLKKDEDPKVHVILEGHKQPLTSISFNPNGQQFATSSQDKGIMIWTKWSEEKQTGPNYRYAGHGDVVTCLDYSSNCKLLASCSKDETVRLWAPTIMGKSDVFKAHTSSVNTVNFSPDSTKLLTGSHDKSLKMWDVESKQFICSFLGHNNWVRCAKFSPLSNLIASCSDDRTTRIWDTISGELIHTFVGSKGSPNYVAMHSNNNTIAVALNNGSVKIFDIRNKKLQQYYELHDNTTCLDWHPRAKYLLTSGRDGKLRIIDIMEGRPLYTLSDNGGVITCKFSQDGAYFASGVDRTVVVWKTNFLS